MGTSMTNQALYTAGETQTRNQVIPSRHELREANQHLHEFLALLGHELRTPLAALRNALHVLELKGEDVATRDWARGIMERQTQRISCLVEDMLEISRIEHGKIKLHKQPLDLAQSVAQAIETVRAVLDGHNHQLEVHLPPGSVVVNADPGRLEQVLTNLLNNAIKYMEPGGHIWVSAEEQGSNVVVRVRDSGLGIASEMLPHIFDPFWQVERTFEYAQNGLGIGLALVRKLAEMHGGGVNAHSAGLGHGSEFVVWLPIHTSNFEDVA
jgi:signal transduction histidine kinase